MPGMRADTTLVGIGAQQFFSRCPCFDASGVVPFLLAQPQPEPQWTVDALLLRSDAKALLGQGAAAASDARQALREAQRLQDGAAESRRAQAARAAQDRAAHVEPWAPQPASRR